MRGPKIASNSLTLVELAKRSQVFRVPKAMRVPGQWVMVMTIARAMKWDQEIRNGISPSKIAKREGLSKSYITRVMPLAFLAPDIVQAIYEGRQPAGLKVKALSVKLPLLWEEQRRVFGFPAR